ncbi:MAG: formate/nitrite transporter family protein [Oscillospiraceae bacterium]|nr:formate/nitrite transporter family protein [Oscillospiraceae bacterium]
MLKSIRSGLAAGILISLGGSVFLACDSRYVGAGLFTVALLCICLRGYALYTGRVGYLPEDHSQAAVSALLLCLLGNSIGTVLCGWAIRIALPKLGETAMTICSAKLEQSWLQTVLRGLFCGVLMYLAVSIYRDRKTVLAIVFCVPVFILAGFEHSVADIFYFAASGLVSLKAFAFIWLVILGNSLGGVLLPLITGDRKERP